VAAWQACSLTLAIGLPEKKKRKEKKGESNV
jgi:hypothetical protein